MNGCTQLTAVNFNYLADTWDYSCNYLFKVFDTSDNTYKCLWFRDVQPESIKNCSFTVSYSMEQKNWVFFHDYLPDFYLHTRENLFNLSNQSLYKHKTEGDYGRFYNHEDIKPFFIDVVFATDSDILLEVVNWMSTVGTSTPDQSDRSDEWQTLTHITIWNSQQHTGRVPLDTIFTNLQYLTDRKTMGKWSMNDFRNILTSRGNDFLLDIFQNYGLNTAFTGTKTWSDKELIEDKYIVVRFEFDNSSGNQLILHDTSIQAQKTNR